MTLNKVLLRGVMAQIESEPESWDQSVWGKKTACGTSFCFAGWAALAKGDEMVFNMDGTAIKVRDGYKEYSIEFYAQKALGLEHKDAYWLFDASRSLQELREGVDRLLRGERAQEVIRKSIMISLNYTDQIFVDVDEDDELTDDRLRALWMANTNVHLTSDVVDASKIMFEAF